MFPREKLLENTLFGVIKYIQFTLSHLYYKKFWMNECKSPIIIFSFIFFFKKKMKKWMF